MTAAFNSPGADADPSQPSVLVVDDDLLVVQTLAQALQPEFDVVTATSPSAALALIETREFDVVLADQRMPNLSGVELLARIRAQCPDTQRILMTAYANLEVATAAVNQARVIGYLKKPWTETELRRVLREAVAERRAREAAQRAEAGLRRSAHELRLITDAIPALISYVDRDLYYRFVNQSYRDWFGHPRTEIEGHQLWEVLGQAAYAAIRPHVELALNGQVAPFEGWIPYQDAGERYVSGTFTPDLGPDGQVAGFFVLVIDITDRKQAEVERERLLAAEAAARARAEAAEASYRGLFEGSVDPVLVTDEQGRYLAVNRALTELVGYSWEELQQLQAEGGSLLAGGREQLASELDVLRAGRVWHGKLELRRKDGSTVPVEAHAQPIQLPTGLVYMSIWRDITERVAAEQLQREFLNLAAHELKNPLAALKGFAELGQRRPALTQQALDGIVRQTARLERLVEDLLDVARLETGRLMLRPTAFDLIALIAESVDQIRAESERHQVLLKTPRSHLEIVADRDRIGQVLANLLSNAVKYSPAGGDVAVAVEIAGDQVRVAVRDQGVGIPVEDLPKLFGRFFRASNASVGSYQGQGIGLHITRGIVEAHGGHIQAQSDGEGLGSTFSFTLPLTASSSEGSAHPEQCS